MSIYFISINNVLIIICKWLTAISLQVWSYSGKEYRNIHMGFFFFVSKYLINKQTHTTVWLAPLSSKNPVSFLLNMKNYSFLTLVHLSKWSQYRFSFFSVLYQTVSFFSLRTRYCTANGSTTFSCRHLVYVLNLDFHITY